MRREDELTLEVASSQRETVTEVSNLRLAPFTAWSTGGPTAQFRVRLVSSPADT